MNIKSAFLIVVMLYQMVSSCFALEGQHQKHHHRHSRRSHHHQHHINLQPHFRHHHRHLNDKRSNDHSVENVIAKIGQRAVLPCFIHDLGSHKVLWTKSGDILSLGTTKINSDNRLTIEHLYQIDWNLIIENVMTEDEGEYICKTNGNFYKPIFLQVQVPPIIDDEHSTPNGIMKVHEDSDVSLKCFANGKPEPTVKWYRWREYRGFKSAKEEIKPLLNSNMLEIKSIKRDDPNVYECSAENPVPPASSRIFNLDIQFAPKINLEVGKTLQFMHKSIDLECRVIGNPIDKVSWYKNRVLFDGDVRREITVKDVANAEFFSKILSLKITRATPDDFGEYQCCASNQFGQTCADAKVEEAKHEQRTLLTTQPPIFRHRTTNKFVHVDNTRPRIISSDESDLLVSEQFEYSSDSYDDDDYDNSNDKLKNFIEQRKNGGRISSRERLSNLIDTKDKRRHYPMTTHGGKGQPGQLTSLSSANVVFNWSLAAATVLIAIELFFYHS